MFEINERFFYINGFDNYIITEHGNVYSIHGDKIKQLAKKGRQYNDRYLSVCLCNNNEHKYVQIHRLVATYFCAGYFNGAVVNHIDCNIHNNEYINLEWISQRDNIHKSYESSGIDQNRNIKKYVLVYPSGYMSHEISGFPNVKKYIEENNICLSSSSLQKYGKSNKYHLIEL